MDSFKYREEKIITKVDFTGGTSPMMMVVKDNLSGTTLASLKVTTSGTYKLKFKAIGGNTYVYAQCSTAYTAPAKFFYIDDVIVEEDKTLQPGYSFGFNGKFKDDETYGSGNSYDFGARVYDPRLGRWMSIDPLTHKYPGFSSYLFALDNPMIFIDPDGKDIGGYLLLVSNSGYRQSLQVMSQSQTFVKLINQFASVNSGENPFNAQTSGKYSYIQLNLTVVKKDEIKGSQGRTTLSYSVGGQMVPAEAYDGKSPIDGVSINVALSNGVVAIPPGSKSAGVVNKSDDYNLTKIAGAAVVSHETGVHVEALAALVDQFTNKETGVVDGDGLTAAYLAWADGGGKVDHDQMKNGTKLTFKEMNKEVTKELNATEVNPSIKHTDGTKERQGDAYDKNIKAQEAKPVEE